MLTYAPIGVSMVKIQNKSLVFLFTLTSAFILSNCGPNSVPWAPDDQKVKLNANQKNTKTSNSSLRVGKYAMSVLSLEFISRNLEVARVLAHEDFALKKGVKLEKNIVDPSVFKLNLNQNLTYKPQQKYVMNQTWILKTESNSENEISKFLSECRNCEYSWTTVLKSGQKNQFNLKTTQDQFEMTLLSPGVYAVKMQSAGVLKGDAFNKNAKFDLNLKSDFKIVLDQVTGNSKVMDLNSQLSLKTGLSVSLTAKELNHFYVENCGRFEGELQHSGGKQKSVLKMNKDFATTTDGWSTKYYACAEQPRLDLGRLLQEDRPFVKK